MDILLNGRLCAIPIDILCRAATIKAKGASSVFQLDRQTFRYVIAKSNAQKSNDIF